MAFAKEKYSPLYQNRDFITKTPIIGDIYGVKEIRGDSDYNKLIEQALAEIKPNNPDRVSIASFGPIMSLHRDDIRTGAYATISKKQPQKLASGINLEKEFGQPLLSAGIRRHDNFFVNTDVNCAVVGEFFLRQIGGRPPFRQHIKGSESEIKRKKDYLNASTLMVYILIGSGIGGGFTWGGYRVRDRMHPEMGHIIVKRHPDDKVRSSCCAFHASCAEGFASDTAHSLRLIETSSHFVAAQIRAYYIAQIIHSVTLTLAPTVIILDQVTGSKNDKEEFLDLVRQEFRGFLGTGRNRYPDYVEMENLSAYIDAPLDGRGHVETGMVGSLYMATRSYQDRAYRDK